MCPVDEYRMQTRYSPLVLQEGVVAGLALTFWLLGAVAVAGPGEEARAVEDCRVGWDALPEPLARVNQPVTHAAPSVAIAPMMATVTAGLFPERCLSCISSSREVDMFPIVHP